MAAGTLYTYPENFRAFKALIAAQYSGAKVTVASDFKFGETNKSDAYLSKFPLGKVPAFESNCGIKLFGDNAIASFVANDDLRGKSASDQAQIQQWIDFGDDEIQPAACAWVFPCLGIMQFNKQNTERSKEDIKRALSVLNKALETRTFLVGERASLADIAVTCNLLGLYKMVLDPEFRKPYQNVNRWFVTMVNQPKVKAVIGETKLADKMAQFDAAKFKEMQGGAQKGGKEKKEQKPKAAQPKKEEKQPEAADDEPPAEKPSKDPFMELPKPNFNFDEWKKVYSNEDTNTVAMPYFFKNFDKENMSVWYCEYSYPEELKLTFMSANLIGGMMQRLDKMRKHSFGNMLLFGESNNSTISGVWFWRGQDLAFELDPNLQIDYSSYTWKKLDYDSEETKTMIKEYFTWEGSFGGKKFNQGKTFK